ncbi:MAG: SIS domain-containing protein [Candidatus Kryptoniota bacterium]
MLPIVYASAERFDAVSLRWRGQISENAKTVAEVYQAEHACEQRLSL